MPCIKCGRTSDNDQVFCPDCLEEMGRYPVKPDTPLYLPVRTETAPQKRPVRRSPPEPGTIIARQQRVIAGLTGTLLVLLLVMGFFAGVGVRWLRNQSKPNIGQNYSTVQPTGE